MDSEKGIRAAEDRFFGALLRGDRAGLESVLDPDFRPC